MTRLTASALRNRAIESGGFTVRINTYGDDYTRDGLWSDGPETGYAVSVNPELTRTFSRDHNFGGGDVALYTLDHLDALTVPGKYFGAWRDDQTGTVHLDVITIVDDLTKALDLAHEHRELAVWDLAKSEEIRVPYAPARAW